MRTMLVLVLRHRIDFDTHQPVIVFWVVRNIYKNEKPSKTHRNRQYDSVSVSCLLKPKSQINNNKNVRGNSVPHFHFLSVSSSYRVFSPRLVRKQQRANHQEES